jgi:hypothetical protein
MGSLLLLSYNVLVPPKPGAGGPLILKIFKTWDESSVILNLRKQKRNHNRWLLAKPRNHTRVCWLLFFSITVR